ncbi:hypothetical protein [Streptomyces syringium]
MAPAFIEPGTLDMGATALKSAKSLRDYGGVVQAPDGDRASG